MSDTPRPRLRYCPVAPFFQCCSTVIGAAGAPSMTVLIRKPPSADTRMPPGDIVYADSQMMAWIGRDTIFDRIRSEPRFVALVKKMGTD